MVIVCVLNIPDLHSARYTSRDKQICKPSLFKILIFHNKDIFFIFLFCTSYYDHPIEKYVLPQCQIYANG